MRIRFFALAVLFATPAFAAPPKFKPVSVAEHIYDGGWEHFVGGGVAAFDCDGDDLPELYAAGGENVATLFRNKSARNGPIVLHADTPEELRITSVIGAYPINIDGDEYSDLVVLRVGENAILRGGVDCSFEPFEGLMFKTHHKWTTAFSATWEGNNQLPTLAFGNYVDRDDPDGPFGTCDDNFLYRPKGSQYEAPIALKPGYCPLSMLFSDWGRSGTQDLRISNDRHYYVSGGQEQLWSLVPKVALYQESDGWASHQLWGMGIASRDLTGDGVPEVMMTSMGDQRLQTREASNEKPMFVDVPFAIGTTAHRPYVGDDGRPSTGWHVAFGDVQNDGLDDIFITKGNVEQMPGLAMEDPNNLLVQQADGRFIETGDVAGLASLHRGRGGVLIDLNLDGALDVAVVNRRAALEVYQNETADRGNWVGVRVLQTNPNRDAIGAWLEIKSGQKSWVREITVGGGHAGGQLGFHHFGLGTENELELRVIWPDETVSEWMSFDANGYFVIRRSGDSLELVH